MIRSEYFSYAPGVEVAGNTTARAQTGEENNSIAIHNIAILEAA
jgi:hypothetical protein